MTQTNTFLERMDKRRQGLWADREEPEVMDGSALEDQCWTGDSDGPVGGDCPSNEASSEIVNEGSVAEPGLVAEICDAGPEKRCDMEPVETLSYLEDIDSLKSRRRTGRQAERRALRSALLSSDSLSSDSLSSDSLSSDSLSSDSISSDSLSSDSSSFLPTF
ncbi:Hypothetical predicted protein [Octopus vulgaris]|uniref:Uncharacterized protein n=1 Tax=Octopus vulgaris TaxID=6645 RepID=A0AA36BS23_OCTVU|nr:Hypothetical predicted protein [Octopus vulgaris]